MELGIEGKVALVAGSSRGLGRAVAEELGAAGAKLVMCARGEETLEGTAGAIREAQGAEVVAVAADLSTAEGVDAVTSTAMERFGHVDILFTNTGGPPAGTFLEHGIEAWEGAVRQNLLSVVRLIRATLPPMQEAGWGRVVNCTSVAVKQPVEGLILSNSVRAAVTGMARTLANEAAPSGVTVNNVLPGFTRTERLVHLAERNAQAHGLTVEEAYAQWEEETPMGRLGEPRELAALVVFLCSERASYITGTSIPVDGGWIRGLV